MSFFISQIVRISGVAALLVCMSASSPTPKPTACVASAFMPEVRLRKIHLVRPDLIPYPISYEIDC
jgi:hypothetical protein